MPKRHDKITKSVNYDYYWDILFCTVPLLAVSCFYYGARPLLMMAAGLLTAYVADCVVTPLHAAGYRAHEPSSEAFAALIVLMMPASAPYYMVVTATIIAVLVKEAFGGEGFPCLPRLSSYCRCHSLKALMYTSRHLHWICRSPALQVPCLPHEPCHFPCRGQDTFLPSGNCPRSALCICRVHMHWLSRQNMPA